PGLARRLRRRREILRERLLDIARIAVENDFENRLAHIEPTGRIGIEEQLPQELLTFDLGRLEQRLAVRGRNLDVIEYDGRQPAERHVARANRAVDVAGERADDVVLERGLRDDERRR